MALFQEIDLDTFSGGQISKIISNSVADQIGLQAGDELLAINDHKVEDVIDVQFYSAEEELELLIHRHGEALVFAAEREYNQELGIEFTHPTFDTDIRRCNNLCEFCFVLQMAPKFRRTLYIKDDDYRYSFLFGHYVTLTNLSEHDWWRIENMGLSPLYVSIHVTDNEKRRAYLRNKNAPDILEQLQWFAERHIEIHTQLVITPNVNDGRIMEKSIQDLAKFWPSVQSISVVPVGLTKQHKYKMRPHTQAEAIATLDYVESLQQIYLDKLGTRFVYLTDEWYLVAQRDVPTITAYDNQQLHENGLGMVRNFLDEWEEIKQEISEYQSPISQPQVDNLQSLTLATATLFADTLQITSTEFTQLTGIDTAVTPIINQKLGDTITVAGLLMGNDLLAQLENSNLGDIVILPRVMFDHPDTITLDDISPQDIANRLKRPIALADSMGDVWDAVIGQSQLMYQPGVSSDGPITLRLLNDDDIQSNTHLS